MDFEVGLIRRRARRKWMLFPLMDMFFIILLFFLVLTSGSTGSFLEEQLGKVNRVPAREMGRAQMLLQLTSDGNLIWLDNTNLSGPGWRNDWSKFVDENSYAVGDTVSLKERMQFLIENSTCLKRDIAAVLRCPPDVSVGVVVSLERNFDAILGSLNADYPGAAYSFHTCLQEGRPEEIAPANINNDDVEEVRITW